MRAMRILLIPVLLAACSPPSAPTDTTSATQPPPAINTVRASAPSTSESAAPVRPGELRTFGDWAVGCDNIALCTMASLNSENDGLVPLVMSVLRQPGPAGAIDLAFDVPGQGTPVTPTAVTIDGRRIALATLNGPAAARVVQAMANGTTLEVLAPGKRARLSLRGASAALRWIDDRQGRAGTATALVAKGSKPASAVPPPLDTPTIRALPPIGTPAAPIPAQVATMRRTADCEETTATPKAWAIGGGATLLALPCSVGTYNTSAALFVLQGGRIERAQADVATGFDPDAQGPGPATAVNAIWRAGELISSAKGRGVGDCGLRQTFVWDCTRLRLSDQSEMGECRGNPNFITTWRTQVVRR